MNLRIPVTVFVTMIACGPVHQGGKAYDTYCGLCHGEDGEGYLAPQANALANPEFLRSASDAFLFDGIVLGRPGTKMSPWGASVGGPLSDEDAQNIVDYMRTWQNDAAVELDESPLVGDAGAGATLYAEECASCHGESGQGGSALSLNHPEFLRAASNGFLRYAIDYGRTGTPMLAYQESFSATERDSIVALIRNWGS